MEGEEEEEEEERDGFQGHVRWSGSLQPPRTPGLKLQKAPSAPEDASVVVCNTQTHTHAPVILDIQGRLTATCHWGEILEGFTFLLFEQKKKKNCHAKDMNTCNLSTPARISCR